MDYKWKWLLKNPSSLVDHLQWQVSRRLGRQPIRRTRLGIRYGDWANFSDYLKHRVVIPEYEVELLRRFIGGRGTPSQSCAIDVGANFGQFTLAMAAVGYRVHAFEPVPSTSARLKRNLELNPQLSRRVLINNCGLYNESGELPFAINDFSPGTSKILTGLAASHVRQGRFKVDTLDRYCTEKGISEVAMLKVDVEGYELHVLQGCKELLKAKKIGAVYLEVISQALREAGASVEMLYEFLSGYQYFPRETAEGGAKRVMSIGDLVDRIDETQNVLWLPNQ